MGHTSAKSRLNAWSELTGFITPVLFYSLAHFTLGLVTPYSVLFTVGGVMLSVILITFITPEVELDGLKEFYNRVNPPGIFWMTWARKNNIEQRPFAISLLHSFVLSLTGIILIFSGLFSLGNIILGNYESLVMSISLLVFSIVLTYHLFPRNLDEEISKAEN